MVQISSKLVKIMPVCMQFSPLVHRPLLIDYLPTFAKEMEALPFHVL